MTCQPKVGKLPTSKTKVSNANQLCGRGRARLPTLPTFFARTYIDRFFLYVRIQVSKVSKVSNGQAQQRFQLANLVQRGLARLASSMEVMNGR